MARPAARPVPARTLVQWLRARTDAQLAQLLRRRPDLGLPAPADLATLASRIAVRTSVQRAVDSLDAWRLRVLEALVLSASSEHVADGKDAAELLGDADISTALDDLSELALIWGQTDELHLVPTVLDAIGPYPASLGRPATTLLRSTSDIVLAPILRSLGLPAASQPRSGASLAHVLSSPVDVNALLAECDPDERSVLERLAAGPPVGLVRDAQLGISADDSGPPKRLIARGLLIPIDAQTVELPREVGLAVRAAAPGAVPLGTVQPTPPTIAANDRRPADADRSGTTAVLDLLRLVDALATDWTQHPPAVLRAGGVGVRELRRTARTLGGDEALTALVVEVSSAAGLIAATNGIDPTYLPTSEYDNWRRHPPAQRWVTLADAWVGMTRQPSLVSQRDERERLITALGPDAERGTVAALRRTVLTVLSTLAPGVAPTQSTAVLARLAWEAPRRASSQRQLIEAILAEADLVGITSAGGLTGYGRAILSGAVSAAEDALAIALPEPVDYVLVQPDLTVVVPGPPTSTLAQELSLVAELESTGGASVYRVTEATVRRALDAGSSASVLSAMFEARSRTPIPQGLSYLIEDVGRRHGLLRTGTASAYLRCDDESLLARVLTDRAVHTLGLRRIAATVVISSAPVARVLEILRSAGYAPAAEAPDGAVLAIAADLPRAPARVSSRLVRLRPAADIDAHASELVRRMRAGDAASQAPRPIHPPVLSFPGVTSASTLGQLREAIRGGRSIRLGYVDAEGIPSQHTILPISMAGGTLRGHAASSQRLEAYPLHRITAVSVLSDDRADELADELVDELVDDPAD
jgi:hypothetical protein